MKVYRLSKKSPSKVCLLTIFILCGIIFCSCSEKPKYGLVSNDGYYLYSYFIRDSQLFVKNMKEFEKQFETKAYKELKQSVDEAEYYMQAEVIYLPIVQKIVSGKKYVFVFETKKKYSDCLMIKRLAFECDQLKDIITFPADGRGYFMKYCSDFPPILNSITSGYLKIKQKDLLRGTLVGDLELNLEDKTKISGSFIIYDKNKFLFFCIPANL